MTLEQLRIFVGVAEALHVTRAAEALHITQSAASTAIATLENRHGIKLFHRIGRRIELTDAGRVFLIEARGVLQRVAEAEMTLSELSGLRRGTIALAASQTMANYWVPPLLHAFKCQYPGIRTSLTVGNTTQVAEAVLAGDADLGFVEGEIVHAQLLQQPVAHDELVLVVGSGHPWATRRIIEPADLVASRWVLRERGSGTRQVFETALVALGIDPAALPLALELPSNEAVRSAVEAGAGASAISRLVVEQSIRLGSLHPVGLTLPGRRFSILTHAERYRSKALQALLDVLAARPAEVS